VRARDFRTVVTKAFGQRRKTVRNSLKSTISDVCGGDDEKIKTIMECKEGASVESIFWRRQLGNQFAQGQSLPESWSSMRPEEFTAAEFVELTRLIFGEGEEDEVLERKVWRKKKHGT